MANFNLNNIDIKSLIEVRNKCMEERKKQADQYKLSMEKEVDILMEMHPCNNDYDYLIFSHIIEKKLKDFNLMSYKICLINAITNFKGCKDVDDNFSISHNLNDAPLKNQSITITNKETNDFIVLYINYKSSNHIKATALKKFNKDLYKDLLYAKSNYIRVRNKETNDLLELWYNFDITLKDLRGVNPVIKLNYHYTNTNLIIDGDKKKIINLWDIKIKWNAYIRGELNERFRRNMFILIHKLQHKLDKIILGRLDYLNKAINSEECGVCLEKKALMPVTHCCNQPLCFKCRERIIVSVCPYCRGDYNRRNN